MYIKTIAADGFRNLKNVDITLDPGSNIFCGDNAQGKTSLLELIWTLAGLRSFRGAKERELFGFDAERIKAALQFHDRDRTQSIAVELGKENRRDRIITVNGVKEQRLSKLFGHLQAVVFTPEDVKLSAGEPAVRRAFLDLSISQIKPGYAAALSRYNRILAQRNALLKEPYNAPDLDIWDKGLAKAGAFLTVYRNVYVKIISRQAAKIYSDLTSGREKLTLEYVSSIYKDREQIPDTVEAADPAYFEHRLSSHRADDLRVSGTLVGVHRDDLHIFVNGNAVREYGSQGQQRSAALSLKLSQAKILEAERGEPPVVLLDDVLSELDTGRRQFILHNLSGFQTLLSSAEDVNGGKRFTVNGGRIYE
jgi:DNA replication and repair protein RecF